MTGAVTLGEYIKNKEKLGAFLWVDRRSTVGGVHPRYLYHQRTRADLPDLPDSALLDQALVDHLDYRLGMDD